MKIFRHLLRLGGRRILPCHLSAVLLGLGVSGCSATIPSLQLTAEHPASPLAAEVPFRAPPSASDLEKSMVPEEHTGNAGDIGSVHGAMDHAGHGMAGTSPPDDAPMNHDDHAATATADGDSR